MRIISSLVIALALLAMRGNPAVAQCGCSPIAPGIGMIFRTTLCSPAPDYVWAGGLAPTSSASVVRGTNLLVCGNIAFPPSTSPAPYWARAWIRNKAAPGNYTFTGMVLLTPGPILFGSTVQSFAVNLPIMTTFPTGEAYVYVAFYNPPLGYYSVTASGGTQDGAIPYPDKGTVVRVNVQ